MFKKNKKLNCKKTKDSFHWALENKKSREELSIGFQCQIGRDPDVYNVDFWLHSTNIYI